MRLDQVMQKVSDRVDGEWLRGKISGQHWRNGNQYRTGYLPVYYRDRLTKSQTENGGSVYVVLSWDTPIAWHTPNDGWTIPPVKYSVSTQNHQVKLSRAVGVDIPWHLVAKTRYLTTDNGAGRIQVECWGVNKRVPYDHAAHDAHVSAVETVTGKTVQAEIGIIECGSSRNIWNCAYLLSDS